MQTRSRSLALMSNRVQRTRRHAEMSFWEAMARRWLAANAPVRLPPIYPKRQAVPASDQLVDSLRQAALL